MRIISGSARGRKLVSPPGKSQDIRPTSDKAREALFNIIHDRLQASRVLDLYAGTGALGLEAASRGARLVTLVDLHHRSLEIIRRNITICNLDPTQVELSVLRHDLRKGLPKTLLTARDTTTFDLIFLDPPYSQGLSLKTLTDLADSRLLSDDGLIVAEERSSETLPEHCGRLELTGQRTYGDTGFWLYTPGHRTQTNPEG